MKIGIMGAMTEEISSLKEQMTGVVTEEVGLRKYHTGKLNGVDVVVVFSRWGKVASAITATTLITQYGINNLIFTGVAGAIDKKLNIGDIVISNQLYQHDMDARPLFKKHEIPLTGKTVFDADEKLVYAAEISCQEFVKNITKYLNPDTRKEFLLEAPVVRVGKIASGDMFISEKLLIDKIVNDMPEVLAVEMEGAAVAQVCYEHTVPFVVIRTISDKADHSANVNFTKFVGSVAKTYSYGVIAGLCKILTEQN